MSEPIRTRVIVTGRVQGVWFRQRTVEMAEGLGLAGWVRNLPDGSVEAVFEGVPARVEQAVAWCGHGPDRARVDSVQTFGEPVEGLTGFRVTG